MAGNSKLRQVSREALLEVRRPDALAAPMIEFAGTRDILEKPRGPETEADSRGGTIETNNYLLLIAIDHYVRESGLSKLYNPVRDANALLEVLLERYCFAPENETAYYLLGDRERDSGKNRYADNTAEFRVYRDSKIMCLYNEEATPKLVKNTLIQMSKKMKEEKDSDPGKCNQLLVYFSGHGVQIEENFVFPFYDFNEEDSDTYLTLTETLSRFQKQNACDNFLFIVDACFSGDAPKGIKSDNPGLEFSRRILMSSGAGETASDGVPGKGSPFSRALCQYLRRQIKHNYLKTKDLHYEMKPDFESFFNKSAPTQEMDYSPLPEVQDGGGSFLFEIREKDIPPLDPFVESFISHLNFKISRNVISEEIDEGVNCDYVIVSAINKSISLHKIHGKVVSNELLKKIEGKRLERPVASFTWSGGGNIWDIIQRGWNLPVTDTVKKACLEGIVDRLRCNPDPDVRRYKNPLCVQLFIENFSQDQTGKVLDFCYELITGLHDCKKGSRDYDPLFIFLLDVREGDVNYFANEEIIDSSFSQPLKDSTLRYSPKFMPFNSESILTRGAAEDWYKYCKYQASFASARFLSIEEEGWLKDYFNGNKKHIVDFIYDTCLRVGIEASQLNSRLF